MTRPLLFAGALALAGLAPQPSRAAPAPGPDRREVRFDLYKWQRRIGAEVAYRERSGAGTEIRSSFAFTDRSTTVPLSATLQLEAGGAPRRFQLWGNTSRRSQVDDRVVVGKGRIAITRQGDTRTVAAPARFFVGSGYAPVILTEELLRYWARRGRPARLAVFPAGELTIQHRGQDAVTTDDGKPVTLERYAIDGLSWGQQTAWLDGAGALAVFKGIDAEFDPFEATATGYSRALPALVARAAADAMASFGETSRALTTPASPVSVFVGARLVDGTGRPPVEDAVVVVRDGKIVAAGPRGRVDVPAGAPTTNLAGKTLLPGLWDMHAHFAQVEWGPIYLAAGATTVRDCANELDFIRSVRDTIAAGRGVGPRILLACLVDGEGESALGNERIRTAQQIPALIQRFVAAGCAQVKIYSSFDPQLIAPLAAAAHAAGLTVTGHIPEGIGPVHAVEAGLDQINHIPYLARAFFPPSYDPDAVLPRPMQQKGIEEIDLTSPRARATLDLFLRRRTVVDPTVALFELFSYPHQVMLRREPGLTRIAEPLKPALSTFGSSADARSQARFLRYLEVLAALHRAGVPIVAGTDQAVPGHSLHRELELYVQAGFTPLEAIQSATIVAARAMKQDAHSGTVEPGKRADFIAIDGDPLADIRALRRISLVVAAGRPYHPAALWRTVGFQP